MRENAVLHSHIPGPCQGLRVHKVHAAAVASTMAGVSACQIVVVAMSTTAQTSSVFEWDGPCVACQHYWEPSKDR